LWSCPASGEVPLCCWRRRHSNQQSCTGAQCHGARTPRTPMSRRQRCLPPPPPPATPSTPLHVCSAEVSREVHSHRPLDLLQDAAYCPALGRVAVGGGSSVKLLDVGAECNEVAADALELPVGHSVEHVGWGQGGQVCGAGCARTLSTAPTSEAWFVRSSEHHTPLLVGGLVCCCRC
jgi:hypothetical protein